jgi:predicted alpha/beta-fold hydrolase
MIRWFLTQKLVKKMEFNLENIKRIAASKGITDFSPDSVRKSSTTFEFDQHFTTKFHIRGEPIKNYYDKLSCSNDVYDVDIPVLFIHSKNDPICL